MEKFSPEEDDLLFRYLNFYESLDKGEIVPDTEAQRHFLKVCKEVQQPITKHEKVYIKYKATLLEKRKKPAVDTTVVRSDAHREIPETESGIPNNNWYTRSDWKKNHPDRR